MCQCPCVDNKGRTVIIEEGRRVPYIDTPGSYRYRCTRICMPPPALCSAVKSCTAVTNRANHVPCLPQQSGSRFQGSRMCVQLYSLYPINGHHYWWYTCTGIVFGNHARHVHMHAPGQAVKMGSAVASGGTSDKRT